jgi:hypothetical protein
LSACNPTLDTDFAPALYGFGVLAIINAILGLAGGDIYDQLTELDRIARAFETPLRHAKCSLTVRSIFVTNGAAAGNSSLIQSTGK